jgi:hypothetical protein
MMGNIPYLLLSPDPAQIVNYGEARIGITDLAAGWGGIRLRCGKDKRFIEGFLDGKWSFTTEEGKKCSLQDLEKRVSDLENKI